MTQGTTRIWSFLVVHSACPVFNDSGSSFLLALRATMLENHRPGGEMGDETQIHSTTIYCAVCLLCTLKAKFFVVVVAVIEQEDMIQGLLGDWTFNSSIPLLTRMTNCFSFSSLNFSLNDYSACLQLVTSPIIDQLFFINNLTILGEGFGKTKNFSVKDFLGNSQSSESS